MENRADSVRADLHNHIITGNNFRNVNFNKVIDCAAESLSDGALFGYNAILGVTDFGDKRYEPFSELLDYEIDFFGDEKRAFYVPEKKVLVVGGQEVFTQEREHVMALGVPMKTRIKGGRTLRDTIKEIKDNNAISVIVHPFSLFGAGYHLQKDLDVLNEVDAIEIHNGEALYIANWKAKKFYESIKQDYPGLGWLASSDGHSLYEIGSSWTEIRKPGLKNEYDFMEQLREFIKYNGESNKKMTNSVVGVIDHTLDLVAIIALNKLKGLVAKK